MSESQEETRGLTYYLWQSEWRHAKLIEAIIHNELVVTARVHRYLHVLLAIRDWYTISIASSSHHFRPPNTVRYELTTRKSLNPLDELCKGKRIE